MARSVSAFAAVLLLLFRDHRHPQPRLSDHTLFLLDGRLVEAGLTAQAFGAPRDRRTRVATAVTSSRGRQHDVK
ncbi:MAG: hypothetical protein RDU89_12050 [bacterium]|nr:hypothetical protein [bacterium]